MKRTHPILGADQGGSMAATIFENAPPAASATPPPLVKDTKKPAEGKGDAKDNNAAKAKDASLTKKE